MQLCGEGLPGRSAKSPCLSSGTLLGRRRRGRTAWRRASAHRPRADRAGSSNSEPGCAVTGRVAARSRRSLGTPRNPFRARPPRSISRRHHQTTGIMGPSCSISSDPPLPANSVDAAQMPPLVGAGAVDVEGVIAERVSVDVACGDDTAGGHGGPARVRGGRSVAAAPRHGGGQAIAISTGSARMMAVVATS